MYAALLDFPVRDGERDAVVAALRPGLVDTRAFDGNVACELLLDDDPSHFLLFELWESEARYDEYQAWRGTPAGTIPGFGAHLTGPFTVVPYTADEH
jgi:quinol monooxygenase YgiN